MIVRPSMLLRLLLAAGLLLSPSQRANAEDDFVGDGVVLSDPSDSWDAAHALALLGNDLFVVGQDTVVGNGEWRIERRSAGHGGMTSTFGTSGVVMANPSFNWDVPNSVAADAASIYVVGMDGRLDSQNTEWRIEKRSREDGSLVPAFGTGGVVLSNPGGSSDEAHAVAYDGTALFIAGGGDGLWRLEKRAPENGALLTTFANGGAVNGASGEAYALAVDASAVYVGGSSGFESWRVEKRHPTTGALLWGLNETFAGVGCGPQGIFALAADATHVYLAGEASGQWRIEKRRTSDGGSVYAQTLPGSGSCDAPRGIAIDGTHMYVAGHRGHVIRIEKRRLSDGALEPTFGSGGVVSGPGFFNELAAITIDAQFMYVAGLDSVAGADVQWRIERRYLSDGALAPATATTTTSVSTTSTTTLPGECTPASIEDCRIGVRFGGGPASDRFNVRCMVTLNGGSDGIDPVAEGIRVILTDADSPSCTAPCFGETIVPQRRGRCWRYTQADRTASGLRSVKLCDVDPARGRYRLVARARRSNLQCLNLPTPHTVGLEIGDDCSPVCDGGPVPTTITTTSLAATTTTTSTLPGGACVPRSVTRSPSAVVNAAPATEDWFAPADAAIEDGRTAFVRLVFGTPSSFLAASSFGFALPAHARVDGITATIVHAARETGTIVDHSVRLMRAGQILTTDRSRPEGWTPAYTAVDYGSASDTWGTSWTAAQVNDPRFGVALRAQYTFFAGNNDAGVDAIRIRVDYCE